MIHIRSCTLFAHIFGKLHTLKHPSHAHTHTVSPTTPPLQGIATVVSPEPVTTIQKTGGTCHVPQPGNSTTVSKVSVLVWAMYTVCRTPFL